MIYAVAMSGGIDSSVVALLLKKQGHQVIGFTMHHFNDKIMPFKQDSISEAVINAQKVAKHLGIDHYTVDLQKEFNEIVINNFISQYKQGLTPNPCTLCNPTIKWGALIERIAAIIRENYDGGDFKIATGHYAKKGYFNGEAAIFRASDIRKDQTYMLWQLNQKQVEQTEFPLSELTKDEIRIIAHEAQIPAAKSKDSQDICFIDRDYTQFLAEYIKAQKGDIVFHDGKKIGEHKGLFYYTIGQRKGLVPWSRPIYVQKIDAKNNRLVVTDDLEKLERSIFQVNNLNTIRNIMPLKAENLYVKVRYNSPEEEVKSLNFEGNFLSVELKDAVKAITPGQSAVFYRDNELLGGGIII